MGYSYRNNGQIKDFWPDDTEDKFYVLESTDLFYLQERIYEKWGDVPSHCIKITSERIHTECLTYDLYDPSDYTNFIIVEKEKV